MQLVTHSVKPADGWMLAGFRSIPAHFANCDGVAGHRVPAHTSGLPFLSKSTWNVPSGLTVHTVPSVLLHVPTRAPGPDVGAVARALMSAINPRAKIIRRESCSFMPGIRMVKTE